MSTPPPPPPPPPPGGSPYGQQPYGQQPYGQQPYGQAYGYGATMEHAQGTTILVLGILSLVICGILGPFAWSMGNKALKEIDADGTYKAIAEKYFGQDVSK